MTGQADETNCSEMISKTKAQVQSKADQSCKSVKVTIPCTDKKSGLPVHVTMVIPPRKKGCSNVVKVKDRVNEGPVSKIDDVRNIWVITVEKQDYE